MSPSVLQLPLDLSGQAVTNKVTAELHIVAAVGTRAIVTTRGPFYSHGLIVRNKTTGAELVPDVDYRPVHMMLEASLRSGQEVCAVLIILPGCNATEIEIDYQAIGGEYSASVTAIEQMLNSLDLDNRTIVWGDLIGAPEYFPPTAHLHDIGDLYGFEYIVAVLEQIRRAILIGDQAAFDELRNYINLQDSLLRSMINERDAQLGDHVGSTTNPHQVTKAQVGLGNVDNFGTATQVDAQDGVVNNLFMTPLRTKQAITAQVGNTLSAHIANTNNPHGTTKAQVGLSNVVNYALASTAQAQAGSGEAYMTATLTGAAITALAVAPLNAHISRTDNPHAVTKAQVSLGNVDNFATASTAQAQAGTANNLFMTPAGTRALVDAVAGNALTSHVARTDNPHSVTKAQVGLGNVQNYAVASTAQAQAGTDNATYMTPLRVKEAINTLAGGNIDAHIARTDNPHNTTKAQVGLGNVLDYGMSDQGNAEAGTSNTLYMSPLRTKQAITAQAYNPLLSAINQRVVTGSNAQLNTLQLGNTGYFYQDGDGSISLRVTGGAYRYFQFQASGHLVAHNGLIIGGAGFQPSDVRLKTDIEDFEARALWRSLDYKSYRMIETDRSQTGVLAQKMLEIAPDRVLEYDHQNPSGRKVKRLSVDYTGAGFEMAMAAGYEVDKLHERVAQQDAVIEQLMARLAALEAKV